MQLSIFRPTVAQCILPLAADRRGSIRVALLFYTLRTSTDRRGIGSQCGSGAFRHS
jgi:hypothetical protein